MARALAPSGGRRSSVDRLPEEIRARIAGLRREGHTIDAILAHLEQLGAEVSRSALGRHVKGLDEIARQVQQTQAVAQALVERFGEEGSSQVSRANIQLMHSVVMRLVVAEESGDLAKLDAREAKFVAEALRNLATAEKTDADRLLQVRRQVAKEAAEKIDAAERDLESGALAADPKAVLKRIREEVYGIQT